MKMKALIEQEIYNHYLDALLNGEKETCKRLVNSLIEKEISLKELYLDLFRKSLYEVGERWERNEISVATEHLATSITSSLMTLAYPLLFQSRKKGKKVVVTSVTNEYHEIGARMIADLLELDGWDSYFLGSNTPVDDLLMLIKEKKPDLLALSVAIFCNIPEAERIVRNINRFFPDLQIILGGQAFQWDGAEIPNKYNNTLLFRDMETFENYLKIA